jgi:hypothetical protein
VDPPESTFGTPQTTLGRTSDIVYKGVRGIEQKRKKKRVHSIHESQGKNTAVKSRLGQV